MQHSLPKQRIVFSLMWDRKGLHSIETLISAFYFVEIVQRNDGCFYFEFDVRTYTG